MTRRLAGGFAALSVLGAAAVVWLVAADRGDGGSGSARGAALAATVPAPEPKPRPKSPAGRGKTVHFTVSASGDLLMHTPLLDRARANGGGDYDFTPFFRRISPYVAGVDLALCHLETPMGPGPPSGYPIFNTPTDLAKSIRRSGWDACDSASNHSLDGGQAGIDGTVRALRRAGLAHTGSFRSRRAARRPVVVDVDGVKVGYVAYTDATNGFAPPHRWSLSRYPAAAPKAGAKKVIRDARRARDAGAEAVIAQLHWGDENSQAPNRSQLEVAKKLAGAKVITAVVGQGPHVVQPIERIKGKFVVFSEGNLVSNQAASTGLPAATQDGLVALLHFRARGDHVRVRRVTYVPTWVRLGDYTVLPARASSDLANAAALRASYRRTVRVVGRGGGVRPGF